MPYKAFVSSTFEDLKDHRSYVISALRKAGFSVDPMEDWVAAISEPKQFSTDRIRGSDLFVLLVAFRRGHVPAGQDLSITQLEFQGTVALGLDVLVFMLDEQAPWPRRFDELDKDPAMRKWRSELLEQKGVSSFGLDPKSIDISPALTRWIDEAHVRRSVHVHERPPQDLATIDRTDLRFGLTLGWQLGRYEFVYDSKFQEARAAQPAILAEIKGALTRDGFTGPIETDYPRLIQGVLTYYGASSLAKHAAILVGIAAMRTSLVGASTNAENNAEMTRLAFSAIQEIDPVVLNDKRRFFETLIDRKPKSIVDVLGVIDAFRF